MQVVCEATQSTSADVQVGAYECLVKIMHLYYDQMKLYMERALFGVSHSSPSRHHSSSDHVSPPLPRLRSISRLTHPLSPFSLASIVIVVN